MTEKLYHDEKNCGEILFYISSVVQKNALDRVYPSMTSNLQSVQEDHECVFLCFVLEYVNSFLNSRNSLFWVCVLLHDMCIKICVQDRFVDQCKLKVFENIGGLRGWKFLASNRWGILNQGQNLPMIN